MSQPLSPILLDILPKQAQWQDATNTNFARAAAALKNPLPLPVYDFFPFSRNTVFGQFNWGNALLPDASLYENCIALVDDGLTLKIIVSDGSRWWDACSSAPDYSLFLERQETTYPTIPTGAWFRRRLTQMVRDDSGTMILNGGAASDANQGVLLLRKGSYVVSGYACGLCCDLFQTRLRDITHNATLAVGMPSYSPFFSGGTNRSPQNTSAIVGYFTLTENTNIELQQYITTAGSTPQGFSGPATLVGGGPSVNTVLASLSFWRTA